ncbi:MAG: bifunctional 4-hydroxy-2-oxoglutarate aldolase/2-dehydro-3-deoxy-phosphogluconate aldolase [Chloroflexi bacterium]|nr:MAG: bifunctional 4-hydroxy-2-oxoglutarate aldolase/2-dehydro-3-deoxy-phosphogluconate aldolase [Chloroflexota bacterium]MBL1195624.1 bifunctional 4-hydroxy-2-oxoglutarate aldolase/2-dehydro-3-deoxy-phosphogluconate aldolase [Chloroflexota bacterium]NOH12912.1 bifunctional 4-hydroxy-2-oxoglutarate aldolase/2-dehydro-3-deoxy-phosphogluconate aldolase [Chloroflexota bacterium]
MSKEKTLQKIQELGVLAVLRGPSPDPTLKMVAALIEGGVTGIEITYTTPNAAEVVKSLDQEFGSQIVLGMGTLTKVEQVKEAQDAGATFLVSPHTETELATAMAACGLPVMMGALTPSEVMQAYALGSDVVKVFPGSLGGPTYMKALKGPFPDIPMMPTGGVSDKNLVDWFAAGAFAVGAGSNLCPKELALAGEFDKITNIARDFMTAVQAARA